MKIGIDLDGCLADFNGPFTSLLVEISGKDREVDVGGGWTLPISQAVRMLDVYPNCWDYPEAGGYSAEEVSRTWAAIINNPNHFWSHLPPLPDAFDALDVLRCSIAHHHEVYFITSRVGICAQEASAAWIVRQGGPRHAAVILCPGERKHLLADDLHLDAVIDDKQGTVEAYAFMAAGQNRRTYLMKQPWNAGLIRTPSEGGRVVGSVLEMLKAEGLA